MESLYPYIEYACYGVTAAVVFLNAVAPLTKTESDNKVLKVLRFVEDKLQMFVLPFLRNRMK